MKLIEIKAQIRNVRMAPRKMRFIADVVRGMNAEDAEAELMLSPRRGASVLLKVLRSAVANAKHNHELNKEKLFVKTITIDGGTVLKRWTPRARGGASSIYKRLSHATIILGVREAGVVQKYVMPVKEKKKHETSKQAKKKVQKQEAESSQVETSEKTKEAGNASELKPTKKTGFFKKSFRRKAI